VGDPLCTCLDGAAAGARDGVSFDHVAAARELRNVDVDGCKRSGGPMGSGHVTVTFAPTGAVTSVHVDQAPFAGSSIERCIDSAFRKVRVPPFAGDPVKVGESFAIF
jgi:hypothetical protein